MPTVVHFGPGNIGLGFFGQIYCESGYEIVFVGRSRGKIDLLNSYREYPLTLLCPGSSTKEIWVKNVRAIEYLDENNLAKAVSSADIISTSVGSANLASIAKPLAKALIARWSRGNFAPINILLGENMVDTDKHFTTLLEKELCDPSLISSFRKIVGVIDTSVERLVPDTTREMRGEHPLRIWARDTISFPVDLDAFKGRIPSVKYMMPIPNFGFYKKRKIFVFNCGHSAMAYLGYLQGYKHMSQAYRDQTIVDVTQHVMIESATALCTEFQVSLRETLDMIAEGFGRGAELDDEICRVARDPLRKISDNERFIGPAKLAVKNGRIPLYLLLVIGAVLRFDSRYDSSCRRMRQILATSGPQRLLSDVSKIDEQSVLSSLIIGFYKMLDDPTILQV